MKKNTKKIAISQSFDDFDKNNPDMVGVGDYVGFKEDYETSGKIVKILNGVLVVECIDSDTNEIYYCDVDCEDAWI